MNIIRDGIILIVYTFTVIIMYIVLSDPLATTIAAIASASDASQMTSIVSEIKTVFSICVAMMTIIPTVTFIYLAFTTNKEEYIY